MQEVGCFMTLVYWLLLRLRDSRPCRILSPWGRKQILVKGMGGAGHCLAHSQHLLRVPADLALPSPPHSLHSHVQLHPVLILPSPLAEFSLSLVFMTE